MRYVLLFLFLFGCIEAPPTELEPNNSENNSNGSENNSNGSENNSNGSENNSNGSENNSNNSENNSNSNNSGINALPYSISTDLALLYLFNQGSSPDGFPNLAPDGVSHFLQDSEVVESEMIVGATESNVMSLGDIFATLTESRELSIEMWWRPFNTLDRNVIRLGDQIAVRVNESHDVEIHIGSEQYAISDIAGPFSTHFVLTLSDKVARVYVDGIQVWAHKIELPPFDDLGDPTLRLGPGNIAYKQVSIYTRVLTPGEIAMHTYQGPGQANRQARRSDLFAEAYRHSDQVDNLRKNFVIASISPTLTSPNFTFSTGQNDSAQPLWYVPLDRDHFPPNSTSIHGYARIQGRHLNAPDPFAFEIEVFALKKPWSLSNVTWMNADAGSEWSQPGAKSEEDRGMTPIFKSDVITFPNANNHPIYLLFPLTALIGPWLDNDENFGLIFDGQDKLNGGLGDDSALKPAMVFFGVSDAQLPIAEPVIEQNGCELTIPRLPAGQKLEVWHNGDFAGVTSGARILLANCDPAALSYSVVDVFGNSTFF